jgi:spore maturation protein SpmB
VVSICPKIKKEVLKHVTFLIKCFVNGAGDGYFVAKEMSISNPINDFLI